MSIRAKTLIVIASITLIMGLTTLFFSQNIFMSSFNDLEKEKVGTDVSRVVSAVSTELNGLDTLNHDWSNWDDTYDFVQHPNEEYIEANISDEGMANAGLNCIIILDPSKNIILSYIFDLENNERIPVWPSLNQHLSDDVLIRHTDKQDSTLGIILLDEGPFMVSSRPILTTTGEGPIAGTIIMGRFLGSAAVNDLAETVHMPLFLSLFKNEEMPPDFRIARSSLSDEKPTFIKTLNHNSIGGYALINDIHGTPALIMKTELPRDIYTEGKHTVHSFLLLMIALGVLFSCAILILLGRVVVMRLSKLSKDVAVVSTSGNLSQRLITSGKDEVSIVANKINDMLSSLEQSQQYLRKSEQKYRTLIENIPQKILYKDRNSVYISCNRNYALDLKISPDEIIGKTDYDFYPRHIAEENITEDRRVIESDKIEVIEGKYTKKGEQRFFEKYKTSVKDEKGEVIGVLAIFYDITERKLMQERVIVNDRLSAVGAMASGIAHELNNPLTCVLGLSQLCIEGELPDDIREDIESINKEARRAATLVNNLLSFARKRELQKHPIQINKVIQDVVELRAYEHRQNNIEINTNYDIQLPEIIGDTVQMQQVFLNIMLNAESAMVEAHRKGTLTITTEKIDGHVKVSFADDGPGIPDEIMGKIFDPFFTTKGVGKGTGLGLSICHGIVTNHNGRIYAKSEIDNGATFIVELPVIKQIVSANTMEAY